MAKEFLKTERDKKVYDLFLKCVPYFQKQEDYRNYLPLKKDPTVHKNWKYFSDLYDVLSQFGINDDDYLEAIFHKTYDEFVSGRKLFPSMLTSEWAMRKYVAYSSTEVKATKPNSKDAKLEAIRMSKVTIMKKIKEWGCEETLKDFFTYLGEGNYFPLCLPLIDSGAVSRLVCCYSKSFWKMVDSLDNDVVAEYLDIEAIKNTRALVVGDEILRQELIKQFGADEFI